MKEDEVVMVSYCGVTFGLSTLLFVLKKLLLRDAARSRLSKAEEYVRPVEIAAWVLLWYGVSVSMVMANRWLFHNWQGTGFPYPVLTTMVHMWLKLMLSRLAFGWCACQNPKPPHLDLSVHIKTVIPIGLATAADILLSNLSFMVVTVTFYTISKSGSLMWILLWACAFNFERMSFTIFSVVAIICTGLFLASWGQTNFSLPGLLMILGASCFSGLRWALVQFLQAVDPTCSDPMAVIYHISPSSAIAMTPMALLDILRGHPEGLQLTTAAILEVAVLIVGTGLFSFMLVYAEVKLLTVTSSLTMGVFGTLKEIIQIAIAVLVFSDHLTPLKVLGLILAMFGSVAYKITKGKPQNCSREGDGKDNRHVGQGGVSMNGSGKGTGPLLSYSAVSQQEVDEELRVFRYTNAEMELEGELEEFSSFNGLEQ